MLRFCRVCYISQTRDGATWVPEVSATCQAKGEAGKRQPE